MFPIDDAFFNAAGKPPFWRDQALIWLAMKAIFAVSSVSSER